MNISQIQSPFQSAYFPLSPILGIHKDGVGLVARHFNVGVETNFLDANFDISESTASDIIKMLNSPAHGEANANSQELITDLEKYRDRIADYASGSKIGLQTTAVLHALTDIIDIVEEIEFQKTGSEGVESHNSPLTAEYPPTFEHIDSTYYLLNEILNQPPEKLPDQFPRTTADIHTMNEVIKKADQEKTVSDIQNIPSKSQYPSHQMIQKMPRALLEESKLGELHSGWCPPHGPGSLFTKVSRNRNDFIEYNELAPSEGKEKLHISVTPEHMETAFKCIAPLLFSKNCPVLVFKFSRLDDLNTDLKNRKINEYSHGRVYNGAQITLYWFQNTAERTISLKEQLKNFAEFALLLEKTLEENCIPKGSVPESDLSVGKYISFRNETYSRYLDNTNKNNEAAFDKMKEDSLVYQAITNAMLSGGK